MKNKNDWKLDLLSKIDDEIIERNTQKRCLRLKKLALRRRVQRITGVSAAAGLLLVCGVIFVLFSLFSKQVPVYLGMTISSAESQVGMSTEHTVTPLSAPISYAVQTFAHGEEHQPKPPHGDVAGVPAHKNENLDDAGKNAEDAAGNTLQVSGSGADIYYAKPNEDIYITIHIDNPDSFEILSFTLNGKKYSSYMFEEGSDMENLILKVNVGDAEGVVEYTIDAIKYVDGTAIKDVRMEGDKTVRAGVATDRQPAAVLFGERVDFFNVSFNVSITDSLDLIAKSQGKLYAMIYDGENVLAINEISPSEISNVSFDGLMPNTTYQYAVGAYYDKLDGTGMGLYVLNVKTFTTKAPVLFENLQISTTQVNFEFLWDQAFANKQISALTLYRGEEKVADVDPDATSLTDLLSNTAYTLVAEYRDGNNTSRLISMEFATAAKAIPSLVLTSKDVTQTSFGFDAKVLDVDAVGSITAIELLHGNDAPVPAASLDVRSFDGLLSNNDYTVRVTYTYDLNDGTGAHTIVKDLTVKTLAKATPSLA
ncbi:MAG: hypothetical protein IKJ35_07290, partial [Clostridia bacterium]|nr:hypothetical protein [Clostridia bacterium]